MPKPPHRAMKSTQVVIVNKLGLHARAAAKLVQLSNQFASQISLEKDGEEADAKSIMEVLMLAGTKDSRLRIVAVGRDESEAVEEIRRLIANKFEEDE
jgi:phosphotransferase system HPr (HPr) family protein